MMSVTSNIFTLLFVRGIYVGTFQPWKNWYGFTAFNIITILTFLFGAWLLPVAFICFTCSVVEHLFEEFSKRVLSSDAQAWQLDLAALKEEHRRLCGISELASKMLSPLFLVQVAAHIPLTCFCFYISVHPPDLMNTEPYFDEVYYMTGTLYWLLLSAVTVAVILVFGSRVNAKIHSFQTILENTNVSDQDQVKLLAFMFYLNAEPKGLSIGGLVVITKNLCLTIAGVIVSYYTVMLSLPS
ncbi:uncharacterized protein [Montipora foliosa]|uniref:uncharacterized protein n=1 Tax=Montipora foliosa TaxID=591990 RepID=UPI0035F1DC40